MRISILIDDVIPLSVLTFCAQHWDGVAERSKSSCDTFFLTESCAFFSQNVRTLLDQSAPVQTNQWSYRSIGSLINQSVLLSIKKNQFRPICIHLGQPILFWIIQNQVIPCKPTKTNQYFRGTKHTVLEPSVPSQTNELKFRTTSQACSRLSFVWDPWSVAGGGRRGDPFRTVQYPFRPISTYLYQVKALQTKQHSFIPISTQQRTIRRKYLISNQQFGVFYPIGYWGFLL